MVCTKSVPRSAMCSSISRCTSHLLDLHLVAADALQTCQRSDLHDMQAAATTEKPQAKSSQYELQTLTTWLLKVRCKATASLWLAEPAA